MSYLRFDEARETKKRLRIYLIIAILLVGLIPQPDRLFGIGDMYDRCRSYYSAFIYVKYWDEGDDCYWGPWPGTIYISVPGFLDAGDMESIGKQILPRGHIYIAPTDNPDTTSWWIWGGIDQPYLWRDRHLINDLGFELLPELEFYWRTRFPSSEGAD